MNSRRELARKERVLILGSVLLIGIFAAAMPFMLRIPAAARSFVVQAHTSCEPFVVDLIAGGGNPKSAITVGEVHVWNDAGYLYVKYVITETDWCLTETHLHIATGLDGIPQKNGNPIPGHFDYSMEHDCVTEYTYQIPLTWDPCDYLYIAAHAVVQLEEPCPAIMYGTSLGSSGVGDRIYEIDVSTLTATELFDTGLSPSSINGPNGNAYDPVNNLLYYSAYASPDSLYFYDFTNPVNNPSGPLLGGKVACAGWYSGKYYYIPQNTGKLYEVTFNADGTINAATKIYEYADKSFNFGDVVITSIGLMYGSSTVNGVGKFWSIDLTDYTYTEISTMAHMQLAFGSDGVLYGHDAGNANFYTIDPVLGTRTVIGSISDLKFTDLASGPYIPCTYQTETAWGDGCPFPGKNWATYFMYHVQPVLWPEGGTATVAFEDLPIGGGNDYDYNDFVVDVSVAGYYRGTDLGALVFTFEAQARGAAYHHDLHMFIPADTFGSEGVWAVEFYDTDGSYLGYVGGLFDNTVDLDLTIFEDTWDALPPNPDQSWSGNTFDGSGLQPGRKTVVVFNFSYAFAFDLTTYTPEYVGVHGDNLFFDPYLYVRNTGEDIHIADSRLIVVPTDWEWPEERAAIWTVYTSGVTAGDPPTFTTDWYTETPTDSKWTP